MASGGIWASRPLAKNPYYSGPVSDHFDGRVFFNPDGIPPAKFADLMRWQFNGQRAKWPATYDSPFHGARPVSSLDVSRTEITHVGHATFLIRTNGLNIVTDPVWSERASPVGFAGPKRINPPTIAKSR